METSKHKTPDFFSREVERERTFFFQEPTAVDGLTVICGGREHCAEDYTIDRKTFPYVGLELVASGQGNLCLNGVSYDLSPGSLFLYGPGIPHQIRTHPQQRLTKLFVDFEGPQALSILRTHGLQIPGFYRLSANAGAIDIFDQLIDSGAEDIPQSPRLCRLLLETLIMLASTHQTPPGEASSQGYETYERCRDFILNHHRRLKQADEVARACHVDPAYLSRLFRRFAHESPYRFLQKEKMKSAALSLVRQGKLVKEVADEFGFPDPYHFTRSFKRVHGVSPDAYRRSHGAPIQE